MPADHLPRHPPVPGGRRADGLCSCCGRSFWLSERPRARELSAGWVAGSQTDRINADGELHLVTCLPPAQLDKLGPEAA